MESSRAIRLRRGPKRQGRIAAKPDQCGSTPSSLTTRRIFARFCRRARCCSTTKLEEAAAAAQLELRPTRTPPRPFSRSAAQRWRAIETSRRLRHSRKRFAGSSCVRRARGARAIEPQDRPAGRSGELRAGCADEQPGKPVCASRAGPRTDRQATCSAPSPSCSSSRSSFRSLRRFTCRTGCCSGGRRTPRAPGRSSTRRSSWIPSPAKRWRRRSDSIAMKQGRCARASQGLRGREGCVTRTAPPGRQDVRGHRGFTDRRAADAPRPAEGLDVPGRLRGARRGRISPSAAWTPRWSKSIRWRSRIRNQWPLTHSRGRFC